MRALAVALERVRRVVENRGELHLEESAPPSSAQLRAVEHSLGSPMPAELRAFFRLCGGMTVWRPWKKGSRHRTVVFKLFSLEEGRRATVDFRDMGEEIDDTRIRGFLARCWAYRPIRPDDLGDVAALYTPIHLERDPFVCALYHDDVAEYFVDEARARSFRSLDDELRAYIDAWLTGAKYYDVV